MKLAPLLGLEVKLDIINVLIAILGSPAAGKKWHDLRKLMEEQKEKMKDRKKGNVAGYGLFYVDFIISGEILNGGVTVKKSANDVKLIGEIENKLSLKLKAGFEAGVRILCIKGMLTATGGVDTALSTGLKCDDSGLGIYFSHEGIKAYFEVEVKADYIQNSKDSTSQSRIGSKGGSNGAGQGGIPLCI